MIPEIEAKTLVYKAGGSLNWFGIDYNCNLYRGCCHGCIYCDSRSDCYGIKDFDNVCVKKDALTILSKNLLSKRKKGVLGIGAMSDTYNPFEKKLEVTRNALKIIRDTGFGVCIDTKSPLIVRDIDLLKDINKKQSVIVKMTITCTDDLLSKKLERHVAVSSKRFEALKQLSDAGIFCGVLLMPILPYINDTEENVIGIVKKSYEAGAKFIYPMFGLTMRTGQREHLYKQLDEDFPGLSAKYQSMYHDNYICNSMHGRRLHALFKQECKKYGILYTMKDIIKAYKKKEEVIEQLTFDL